MFSHGDSLYSRNTHFHVALSVFIYYYYYLCYLFNVFLFFIIYLFLWVGVGVGISERYIIFWGVWSSVTDRYKGMSECLTYIALRNI